MLDSLSVSGGTGGLLLALGGIVVLAILVAVLRRRKRRGHHTLIAGHRLAVVDQIPIDETRRLVLIQRDEVQHLVILGGGSDFLVESGIGAVRAQEAPHARMAVRHDDVPADAEPAAAKPSRPLAAPLNREAEPAAAPPATPPVAAPAAKPAHTPFQTHRPPPGLEPARPRPAAPVRAEAAVEPAPARPGASAAPSERTEAGQRVAVKLDPFFAGMVEQLEETLRRPTPSARGAQLTAAAVTMTEDVSEAPAPARAAPEVQAVLAPAETPATAAPIPEILPPNAVTPGQAPSPEVVPPTVEDRPASGDLFEQEMASLLGRTRRP